MKEDDIQAFPKIQEPGYPTSAQKGMTLRDYFAGKALPTALESKATRGVDVKTIAEACYGIADAMLKARKL